jgi:hypothetical protein
MQKSSPIHFIESEIILAARNPALYRVIPFCSEILPFINENVLVAGMDPHIELL